MSGETEFFKKGMLGRVIEGVDAKSFGADLREGQELRMIPVDRIADNPDQPRLEFPRFDEEYLSLCADIKEHGIRTAITVQQIPDGHLAFQLIAGQRRLAAAREAGLTEIPAVVHGVISKSEALHIAMSENLHRKQLNDFEEVRSYVVIAAHELGMEPDDVVTQLYAWNNAVNRNLVKTEEAKRCAEKMEEVLARVGRWELSTMTRKKLALLRHSKELQAAMESGIITPAVAKVLHSLKHKALAVRRQEFLAEETRKFVEAGQLKQPHDQMPVAAVKVLVEQWKKDAGLTGETRPAIRPADLKRARGIFERGVAGLAGEEKERGDALLKELLSLIS